jgi:catechol 2,3-dioxygenase-like lactoylglutathione lyase family enzyme
MSNRRTPAFLLAVVAIAAAGPGPAQAAEANIHQISITVPSPAEAVRWYGRHLGCQAVPNRSDTTRCSSVELVFIVQPTQGGSQGTGVNHIGFTFPNVAQKMAEFEKVGVRGSGVRLQRQPDGSLFRDVPKLFTIAFIFDPWGTRIELVEDGESPGFHHVHLSAADPAATLAWYRERFGGKPSKLKGQIDGLLFGSVWLLVAKNNEGTPAPTAGRAIDHLTFIAKDFDGAAADLRRVKVAFTDGPAVPKGGRSQAKRAVFTGPDRVKLAIVQTGYAGIDVDRASPAVAADARGPYTVPRTPWGEPDLQGVWTGNSAHGIPLERPANLADRQALTREEAEARRERGTLGSIWGYEREWRDTTLGYVKTAPSTQVSVVIDPPDGRMPPLTEAGKKRAEEARLLRSGDENSLGGMARPPAGPEDLSPYVRCITRGLPGMMLPIGYNNGLQIVQGPGFVTIQKEMIHETRLVPTKPRERVGDRLSTWLGDPQGRWEGDTLVIESTNFNGRAPFQQETADMKLTERFTRIGPGQLEYRFTVDDPKIWTRPWTGLIVFDRDDAQYELVEYSCHEGNYGMTGILSGARAGEKGGTADAR